MPPHPAWLARLRQRLGTLGVFAARSERQFARRASGELLRLHTEAHRAAPQLRGRELYQAVLARRLGPEGPRAAEIVRRAEESFTDWPVERELRFQHVVHYQVFMEFTRRGGERRGTRTNIGEIVARIIPADL